MTTSSSPSNPWFTVSVGLMGLILGFSLASFTTGGALRGATQPAVPSAPNVPSAPSAPTESPVPVVTADEHYRGSPSAKVTIVEYIDFECPFCKQNHNTMKQVVQAYGNDVAHVIRHFPLDFHPNAEKEAEASECIADLGGNDAFWKFHDLILDRTTSGGTGFALDALAPLAKEIGVDSAKFQSCLDSGKFQQKVKDEQNVGAQAGINGTPGIVVINNATGEQKRLPGAVPLSDYQTVINPMLGK